MAFRPVDEVWVDPALARVHEEGWQSWTPSTTYRLDQPPHRPVNARNHLLCYRPGHAAPPDRFLGDGLLAVDPGDGGPVRIVAAAGADTAVPRIRGQVTGDVLRLEADGEVEVSADEGPGGVEGALARWAERFAFIASPDIRPAPRLWCSWYQYFTDVSEQDIDENVAAIDDLDLPVDVVQIDDGYQTATGDWLSLSDRFSSLPALVDRIRARGRRAGIWLAPFLVGARSTTAAAHPEWLVQAQDGGPVDAGHNWDQDLYALDITHPDAEEHLRRVFGTLRSWGFDMYKVDFLYAGALTGRRRDDISGVAAYRRGLTVIREAIGPAAYLLGCGAPILPSVGGVDAMRVSPDTAPHVDSHGGDLSQPGSRAASLTGRGRAYQHARFWVNDPDCLLARPGMAGRRRWAAHVRRYGGLRASSDRLAELDEWGLRTTRELLADVPAEPFVAG